MCKHRYNEMSASSFSDVLQSLGEMIQNSQSSVLSDDAERLCDAIMNLPQERRDTFVEKPEEILNQEEIREEIFKASLEDYFEETREKEEASHPSQLMKKFDETIKRLPLKLREKIYKENLEMVKKEREAMGWVEVHEELLEKPSSESLEQIVAVRKCQECGVGCFVGTTPLCWLCEQEIHRMLYEAENMSDVELLLEDAERRSRSSQRTLSLEELD